jgi:hypothetical protein
MKYSRAKLRSYDLLGKSHAAVYGEDRTRRLAELAETANTNHLQAEEHWKGFLNFAQQAGIALLHARKILGGRSKWSKWRAKNFQGSKEKCNQYIRVAKHWNDPRIIQARWEATINSVEGFLNVIRNRRDKKNGEQSLETPNKWKLESQEFRDNLRKWFAESLLKLELKELEVFSESFYELFWEVLYAALKDRVCLVTDCNWYADEPAGWTRDEGQKIMRVLCGDVLARRAVPAV